MLAAASAWRRVVTGLLVLALLVLSSAQGGASAMLPGPDHHISQAVRQTEVVANPAPSPRSASGHHCDHGLACCLGGACTMHLVWAPAAPLVLASVPFLGEAYTPGPDHTSVRFIPAPTAPPPRSLV
jgi:hypothetical protein